MFLFRPILNDRQMVRKEWLSLTPSTPHQEFIDSYGNNVFRSLLVAGENIVHHDALVAVSAQKEDCDPNVLPQPIDKLPAGILRYTLPSRYCDSDKLLNFAWQHFGHLTHGLERIQAICDWVHKNIEYRVGSGRTDTSASDILKTRVGVCRDFAHVSISLCRALNLPARYVVGHLPDIGCSNPGIPMDYHAYFEVYLGDEWYTFDSRFNTPRVGRIKVAQGLDAVDTAFSTIYGDTRLVWFEVWAYQVNPNQVSIGDPVDLSKRLDGSPYILFN
jgi:transglutaminase-like putative cysteine protease